MHFPKFALALTLTTALFACSKTDGDRVTREPGETASEAASKEVVPKPSANVGGAPVVSVSSQSGDLGPQGLFAATKPGWHSIQPPKYPESIVVDFQAPKAMTFVGLLQQEGQPARGPKALRIEVSDDAKAWVAVGGTDDACAPNMPDGWTNINFSKAAANRYLKVTIFSNCGDQQLLTLRGLRVD